jgi:hypothetical protein
MAEAPPIATSDITLPTPFGPLRVTGIMGIFVVLIFAMWYYVYAENNKRMLEHEELRREIATLDCKTDIEIFVHGFPRGQIDWSQLSSGNYTCLPEFMQGKVR